MSRIILVTGGARSGKSTYALEQAKGYSKQVFIATAQAIDDEMRGRIDAHRAVRGDSFLTVEEPVDLASAITALPDDTEVALIDCLTVWVGNLMHTHGDGAQQFPEVDELLKVIAAPRCDLVFVTNEVGMGVVPQSEMGRAFRDIAGRLNQDIARLAHEVVFVVSGIPTTIKKED